MHSLIITAHPSHEGFTHRIAAAYRSQREKLGHTTETLDLYAAEWRLPFFHFETRESMRILSPEQVVMQDKVSRADEIVVVFPVWWVSMPAILKNFFDSIFTSGFAYRYIPGKTFPQQLLKGKTARVFATCDAR